MCGADRKVHGQSEIHKTELLTESAGERFVGRAERLSSSTMYLLAMISTFAPLVFDNGTAARAELAFSKGKVRNRIPMRDFMVSISPMKISNHDGGLGGHNLKATLFIYVPIIQTRRWSRVESKASYVARFCGH